MKLPNRLFLQWHGNAEDPEFYTDSPDLASVTWSTERIYDHDIGPFILQSEVMSEDKARKILDGMLNENDDIIPNGDFYQKYPYLYQDIISLDGNYSIEHLLAIAWWMQNKRKPPLING